MPQKHLRYKYDFMRFPMENDQNYELVVRSDSGAPRAYDIYVFKSESFPLSASLFYYFIDLDNYSEEEILEGLQSWGYSSLQAFQKYLAEETVIHNYELRLATCMRENDLSLTPKTLIEEDYDACFDYLVERLGGRSPLDDTDDEHPEDQKKPHWHDIGFW